MGCWGFRFSWLLVFCGAVPETTDEKKAGLTRIGFLVDPNISHVARCLVSIQYKMLIHSPHYGVEAQPVPYVLTLMTVLPPEALNWFLRN